LPRWRAAREIIDWSNHGRSLLDDPKYIKRPLSINTRRRIARGLEKYGGVYAPYYIRLLGIDVPEYGGEGTPEGFTIACRSHSAPRGMDEPVQTITASNGGGNLTLVKPTVEPLGLLNNPVCLETTYDYEGKPHFAEPLQDIAARNKLSGNGPFMIQREIKPFVLGQQSCSAARGAENPLPTVSTAGAISLVEPQIVVFHGRSTTQEIDKPLPSQPTHSKAGLVEPQLVSYYSNTQHSCPVENPAPTVTTKDRLGLVEPTAEPFIVQPRLYGREKNGGPVRAPHSITEPPPAVTSHGAGALVEPVIIQTDQTGGNGIYAYTPESPLKTVVTKNNLGLADPTIEPVLAEVAGREIDPRRLVMVDGELRMLDIRFRMLNNHELARAMGFDDAETEYEFMGTVAEVTKQIGNAVPVNMATALVTAILGSK
jgi:DNA (cytosine-5)-methyltransferase 1